MNPRAKIQKALQHVNSIYPEVTEVEFDNSGWLFSDGNGNAPAFEALMVDFDIIQAAHDAAYEHYPLPATFVLDAVCEEHQD